MPTAFLRQGPEEQDYYLHPELFGQLESKSIAAAQKSASSPEQIVANLSFK
jgi:hypothetical protein